MQPLPSGVCARIFNRIAIQGEDADARRSSPAIIKIDSSFFPSEPAGLKKQIQLLIKPNPDVEDGTL
jgi:hypothetical protein